MVRAAKSCAGCGGMLGDNIRCAVIDGEQYHSACAATMHRALKLMESLEMENSRLREMRSLI